MSKRIFVIDSETDPFLFGRIPEPFLWGLYDGEDYYEFDDAGKLIAFCATQECIVYAHNGGKFDYAFFFPFMNLWEEDVLIINGRLARFQIGDAEFRDSYNILPIPLNAWQKDKIDYNIFELEERHKKENYQKIREYLKTDCIYLYELVMKFREEFGDKLTVAGASLKHWAKTTKYEIPKSNQAYFNHFSKYYFGGRTECFKSGVFLNHPIKLIDLNSAYPDAMCYEHPYKPDSFFIEEREPKEIKGHNFYTIECVANGCFPVRAENDELFFPTDNEKRIYHVTGWELICAIETKTLKELRHIEHVVFTSRITFKEYIMAQYAIREKHKGIMEQIKNSDKLYENNYDYKESKSKDLFAKFRLVSLYGKFGSNPGKYKKHIIKSVEECLKFKDYNIDGLISADYCLLGTPLEEKDMQFYNVATAASITGFVRAKLWRNICKCKNVLYCDTDSIVCEDFFDIPLTKTLGDFSLDGEFTIGAIGGKKLYIFVDETKTKINEETGKEEFTVVKRASKGARISDEALHHVCAGIYQTFKPDSPDFSIKRGGFSFTEKYIKPTDKNYSYNEEESLEYLKRVKLEPLKPGEKPGKKHAKFAPALKELRHKKTAFWVD